MYRHPETGMLLPFLWTAGSEILATSPHDYFERPDSQTKGPNSRKRPRGTSNKSGAKRAKTQANKSKQEKKKKGASQGTGSKAAKTQPKASNKGYKKQKGPGTSAMTTKTKAKANNQGSKKKKGASQGAGTKTAKTQPKASNQGSKKQKGACPGTSTMTTKTQAKANNQGSKKQKVEVKEGIPKHEELEGLGIDIGDGWMILGRRLKVDNQLDSINNGYDGLSEKGYRMLIHWKQKNGARATYKILSDALKHKLLQRKDLAEKYCCKRR